MTQRTSPGHRVRELTTAVSGGIGESPVRPDGTLKVRGEFAYSSDLWHEDMLWGATLRSPHPYARILAVDITEAVRMPGVYAVMTHEDVPGANIYGLEHADQPVLAVDVVRYQGEPVALVAADHPETAQRAAKRIRVEYEVLDPVTDMVAAAKGEGPALHPDGNVVRYLRIRKGEVEATADVMVVGEYEVGMQDQAFLGPESGLAVPAEDGGVDLYVATQWLHVDQRQVAHALGLPLEKVRLTLAGVGGAFGGREDLSMQVHACMLALRTGRPVKMVYNREESFFGHVHRHPAKIYYEHGATRDGDLVYVRAKIYLDGGAYASSTPAVVANAATLGAGPYKVDNVAIDCWGVYTNNPPCGAMRGFGAVQAAFGYESQMDRLAERLGMDPVEFRMRNAIAEGDTMPTGQRIDSPAPVAELLRRVRDLPLPPERRGRVDIRELPGGVSNTTHGEGVVRGVGYGVGIKNICFSEGFDDYSTARLRLQVIGGEPTAMIHTAAAEVGQGLVTVKQQIVRTELGVERVTVHPMDTSVGNGGSTSASRQTYVTGGAVRKACHTVRDRVLRMAAHRLGVPQEGLSLAGGKVVDARGAALADLAEVLGEEVVEATEEYRHRPTYRVDAERGQGDAHVQYGFAAHRAVVDVDVELGLVRVVQLDCAQDVGRAINPQAVLGQIHGGSAQGLGLAVMEEIQVVGGKVRNPSFTDYLIPTILDMPPMTVDVLELADPHAPYGLRGVGEPPTISSTPAIVAAIRAATGRALHRVPVRPEHITGT
ncbi:xanthine dehydrogenase, molybdenum binding subunit apoprotein [Streptoalloteichus tenebrarius]|uniref:Xanthine dehydrogenase, molybdenum binding subunit apoprotein n=1 Tax=Streptoalloteichus tenebrarius (strain ATCC 17920 / DSM 40477 / JCM 4838 / CBS 697.72 / NBRC 16177 / NCIMB 11028 / NRRL B-12390 / A12253. 1 / ISP 5477) TaxID=1933 RepID=A0ABT1I1W6_STRSD|nr:xanthine dehydrogenase subunit D [Streptoalloteichus tenebrarius]MCP2261766.1 xanthine dehydrogenase, molybdenum binding subunit apoprotein [Streptoalloteichus tenebrarius]BFF00823.1 xanthine dehydrogenase subunit D [Streptoalloteichus tenebrarius]